MACGDSSAIPMTRSDEQLQSALLQLQQPAEAAVVLLVAASAGLGTSARQAHLQPLPPHAMLEAQSLWPLIRASKRLLLN